MKQLIILGMLCCMLTTHAQSKVSAYTPDNKDIVKEKRIKFNKGTLKICTTSSMKVRGYDGDVVIIKSLRPDAYSIVKAKKTTSSTKLKNLKASGRDILINDILINEAREFFPEDKDSVAREYYAIARVLNPEDNDSTAYYTGAYIKSVSDKNNLKRLGKSKPITNAVDSRLEIVQKDGELLISDLTNSRGYLITNSRSEYEVWIPNTISFLNWNSEGCLKTKKNPFFVTSSPWELSDFSGDTEISSSFSPILLKDVNGSVIANTLNGNIRVIFDKTTPQKLYSIISKTGYIDVKLPLSSNVNINTSSKDILSDIDFKINKDELTNGTKKMKLQLNSGKIKMRLESEAGNIYLRKAN